MTLEDILKKKEAGKAKVVAFMQAWGHPYAPTLEEIAAGTGVTPSSVNRYVNELCAEGYLSREQGVYRSIAITEYGKAHRYEPKPVQIPVPA